MSEAGDLRFGYVFDEPDWGYELLDLAVPQQVFLLWMYFANGSFWDMRLVPASEAGLAWMRSFLSDTIKCEKAAGPLAGKLYRDGDEGYEYAAGHPVFLQPRPDAEFVGGLRSA